MDKPTIGIAMIVKNEVGRIKTLHKALKDHVDGFFLTVSDEAAAKKIQKQLPDAVVEYRKWTDNFAAARNANLKLVTTDYWLWIDADDIVKGASNLRDMVRDMREANVDIMYLPYHYKIDELGQTVSHQWRERIVKTSLTGEWKGIIHETYVWEESVNTHKTDGCQIYHIKSEEEWDNSLHRNHKLLLKGYNQKPKDPRYTHYLAISYGALKDYENSIKLFLEYIQESGWPEEIYHSYIQIADALHHMGKYQDEVDAALQAVKIFPHFPDAYYMLQQAAHELDEHEKALEWFSIAESKPVPETNRAKDPTTYKYKAKLMAVVSLMYLGQPKSAYKIMLNVEKVASKDKLFKELMPEVVKAYYEAEAIDKVKWLTSFEKDANGDPLKAIQSLPNNLQGDPRLQEILADVLPPVTWPEKSIVFYCGPGLEFWGPDTLDKGMGGSEEAIVYLSRALAKMGWDVTVYNDHEEEYTDPVNNVTYKPWTLFNSKDTFDVLIAWRSPDFHREMQTKARIRGIDMHDTPVGHQYISKENLEYIDKVFLKSEYQYSMADYIPKEKVEIISNGIVKEQFDEAR